jgi:hypothetical protein
VVTFAKAEMDLEERRKLIQNKTREEAGRD